MHILVHLYQDKDLVGLLCFMNAYAYEDLLGKLKLLFKSKRYLIEEFSNRFSIKGYLIDTSQKNRSKASIKKKNPKFRTELSQLGFDVNNCNFFSICNHNHFKISCLDYNKKKEQMMCNNNFHTIHEIFVCNNEIFLFLEQIDVHPYTICNPDYFDPIQLFNFHKVKSTQTKKYFVYNIASVQKQMYFQEIKPDNFAQDICGSYIIDIEV